MCACFLLNEFFAEPKCEQYSSVVIPHFLLPVCLGLVKVLSDVFVGC
jgi:hypothetical protein